MNQPISHAILFGLSAFALFEARRRSDYGNPLALASQTIMAAGAVAAMSLLAFSVGLLPGASGRTVAAAVVTAALVWASTMESGPSKRKKAQLFLAVGAGMYLMGFSSAPTP